MKNPDVLGRVFTARRARMNKYGNQIAVAVSKTAAAF